MNRKQERARRKILGVASRDTLGSGGMIPEANGLWHRAGITAD